MFFFWIRNTLFEVEMTQYHSMTITNSESITHYFNVIKLYQII